MIIKPSILFSSALLILIGVVPYHCFGQKNLWNGKWKLDEERSRGVGPNFIMEVDSQGMYKVDAGRYRFSFRCDGKDYPLLGSSTIVCTRSDLRSMDTITKMNGRIVSTRHDKLTSDGNNLIQTVVITHSDGSKSNEIKIFQRLTKGQGLAGAWRDKHSLDREPQIIDTSLTDGRLLIEFPLQKQYTSVKLDGTDAVTHGVTVGSRITLAIRIDGLHQLDTTQKIDGKVVSLGLLLLSEDGSQLIEESWPPNHPSDKLRLIYYRQ